MDQETLINLILVICFLIVEKEKTGSQAIHVLFFS